MKAEVVVDREEVLDNKDVLNNKEVDYMKIGVSAVSGSLDAQVDPRFGRCAYFVMVNPDTMEFEAIVNKSRDAMGGAGIATAQTVANKGIDVLITGDIGPNAFQTLNNAGIKILTGANGTVREVVEQYKNGRLTVATSATVGAKKRRGRGRGMVPL